MYLLPMQLAYDATVRFWELVFCYGSNGQHFELSLSEFKAGDGNSLDPKTFNKYLGDALEAGILTRHFDASGQDLSLSNRPSPTNSVPKPDGFILNDWLNKILESGPYENRILWTLNFLIYERWTTLNKNNFTKLISSLRAHAFGYKLGYLKRLIETARGRKTESPKEALQVLWKLGIIQPKTLQTFQRPEKDQIWEFFIHLNKFEEEAFARIEPYHIPVIALDIFCCLLSRQIKRSRLSASVLATEGLPFNLKYMLDRTRAYLSDQGLELSEKFSLESLILDLCHELEHQGLLFWPTDSLMLIKSPKLGNRHVLQSLSKLVAHRHIRRTVIEDLAEAMEPLIKFRNAALGNLILELGNEHGLQASDCVNLFLYLEKNLDSISEKYYGDFGTYCRTRLNLLKLGVGYPDIFNDFIKSLGFEPKSVPKVATIQKTILMRNQEKTITISVPAAHASFRWFRFRRILSLSSSGLRILTKPIYLSIELRNNHETIIYKEDIRVIGLKKEELAPTANLAAKIGVNTLPLRLHLFLSHPLPNLAIQSIFEYE